MKWCRGDWNSWELWRLGLARNYNRTMSTGKHAEEDYLQGKLRETESERITRPFLLNNALRQIISFNFQTYIKMFFLKLKDSSSTSKVEFHAKSTDMAFLKAAYLSLSLSHWSNHREAIAIEPDLVSFTFDTKIFASLGFVHTIFVKDKSHNYEIV